MRMYIHYLCKKSAFERRFVNDVRFSVRLISGRSESVVCGPETKKEKIYRTAFQLGRWFPFVSGSRMLDPLSALPASERFASGARLSGGTFTIAPNCSEGNESRLAAFAKL